MAEDISIMRALDRNGYIVTMVFREVDKRTIDEIVRTVPELIAAQYAKDHMQDIMERVSVSEITSCIAAAVAQKIAEAYKPNAL